jgi:hypothetical protein
MHNRNIIKAFIYILVFKYTAKLHAQNTLVVSDLVNHSFKNQHKSTAFSLDKPKHDLKESETINFLGYYRSSASNYVFNFLPAIVANGLTTFCAGQIAELSINISNRRFAKNLFSVSSEYQALKVNIERVTISLEQTAGLYFFEMKE